LHAALYLSAVLVLVAGIVSFVLLRRDPEREPEAPAGPAGPAA
jgi:hypothetical protein